MDLPLIIALEDLEVPVEVLEDQMLVDLAVTLEALDLGIQDLEVWASEEILDLDQPQLLMLAVLHPMDLVQAQILLDLDQAAAQASLQLATLMLEAHQLQTQALEEHPTALDQAPTLIQDQAPLLILVQAALQTQGQVLQLSEDLAQVLVVRQALPTTEQVHQISTELQDHQLLKQ